MRQMERNMGMFNFKSASGEAMKQGHGEEDREDWPVMWNASKVQHRELLKELR
jgi:hypothetical protein